MRRALTLCGVAILAGTLAGAAAAKEMAVSLATPGPATLDPGEPWNAELLVHGEPDILAEATPGIWIRSSDGGERTFRARPTGERASDGQLVYRATVVFPAEGRWTYDLVDGFSDRAYKGGLVTVGDPAPAVSPQAPPASGAAAADDSFPLWPLVGGLLVALVAAAVAVAVVRRGRLAAER